MNKSENQLIAEVIAILEGHEVTDYRFTMQCIYYLCEKQTKDFICIKLEGGAEPGLIFYYPVCAEHASAIQIPNGYERVL